MEFFSKLIGGLVRSVIISAIIFVAGYSFMTGKFPPDFDKMKQSLTMIKGFQNVFAKTAEKAPPGETPEQMMARLARDIKESDDALARLKSKSTQASIPNAAPGSEEEEINKLMAKGSADAAAASAGAETTTPAIDPNSTPTVVSNAPSNSLEAVSLKMDGAKAAAQKLNLPEGTMASLVAQKDIDYIIASVRYLRTEMDKMKAEIQSMKEKKTPETSAAK